MTFELTPREPDVPRTDPRRSNRKRSPSGKSVTFTLPMNLILPVAVGVVACAAGWGVGMRSGYTYAKQDAAAIMSLEGGATYAKPNWRAFADKPVQYDPPLQTGLLMSMIGGTIPGTGGMTTGDIWHGSQNRMRREFYRDPRVS